MRREQCRTARDHIPIWINTAKNAALQTCVDSLNLCLNPKEILINLQHRLKDRRLHIRLPSRIASKGLALCACHLKDCANLLCKKILCRIYRASEHTFYHHLAILFSNNSHIVGGLHHTRHRIGHSCNRAWASEKRTQKRERTLIIHSLSSRSSCRSHNNIRILVCSGILVLYICKQSCNNLLCLSNTLLLKSNGCKCLSRNGIAGCTALNIHKFGTKFLNHRKQSSCEHLDCICSIEYYIHSRMAPYKALCSNVKGLISCRNRSSCAVEICLHIKTAGTTHIKFALCLGVKIYENLTLEQPWFKRPCANHTCLLCSGKESLNWAMLNIVGLQNCHCSGNTQTIVCTQSGTCSPYPVALNSGLDRILLKIKLHIAVLLRNHIQVSLKNNALSILHTLCCRLPYYYIAGLILDSLQTKLLSKVIGKLNYLLLLSGRAWTLCQIIKILPNTFWTKICNCAHS